MNPPQPQLATARAKSPASCTTPGPSTTPEMEEKLDLAAVSLSSKIPDFWSDQPRVWFIRTEAILAPQKMGDESKFNIVVSKLGKDVIQQVTDLLVDPPATNKYDALRSRLLIIYEESENRQIQKLIGEMELGDQKPSQLLRRMKDLARSKIPDETLRILWQGHLPSAARAVLTVSEIKDMDKLADIADRIIESTRPAQVSSVAQASVSNNKILAEIAKINARLNNLDRGRSNQRASYENQRSASRPRSPSAQGRSPKSPDWLCFYHFRYRTRANKCVKPCAWKGKTEQEN